MIELWQLYKGGELVGRFAGMGGGGAFHGRMVGHLPDAGGTLDQAAIMLEAFAIMSAAEARMKAAGEG
jgi:hypothetical protein